MGRPKGSKNKPKPMPSLPETKRTLVESERAVIVAMYDFLMAPPDDWPPPRNNLERVIQNTVRRASDPEEAAGHQYIKLILERVIPQRKQVEHLGDQDAKMGVNINISTETPKHGNAREPIEHEPSGRRESHGTGLHGGREEKQPAALVFSRENAEPESG